jgi:hypothetical protein
MWGLKGKGQMILVPRFSELLAKSMACTVDFAMIHLKPSVSYEKAVLFTKFSAQLKQASPNGDA